MILDLPSSTAGAADVAEWFSIGYDNDFTHLIVTRYRRVGQFPYDFPIWVGITDDAKELVNDLEQDEGFEVLDVYDLTIDFEDQFWETRCRNF